jgi:hypothetical protein
MHCSRCRKWQSEDSPVLTLLQVETILASLYGATIHMNLQLQCAPNMQLTLPTHTVVGHLDDVARRRHLGDACRGALPLPRTTPKRQQVSQRAFGVHVHTHIGCRGTAAQECPS